MEFKEEKYSSDEDVLKCLDDISISTYEREEEEEIIDEEDGGESEASINDEAIDDIFITRECIRSHY